MSTDIVWEKGHMYEQHISHLTPMSRSHDSFSKPLTGSSKLKFKHNYNLVIVWISLTLTALVAQYT